MPTVVFGRRAPGAADAADRAALRKTHGLLSEGPTPRWSAGPGFVFMASEMGELSSILRAMVGPIDREFTLLLARAFDLAWQQYYGPEHAGTLAEEIARPALAKCLVEMAQSGVNEEEALAACGVLHLVALTTNGPST